MIAGMGIDLVAVDRIGNLRKRHGERFLQKVFTSAEVEDCLSRGAPDQGLAARFAAKEAAMKALGTGFAEGVSWRDIEVESAGGRPVLKLKGKAAHLAGLMGAKIFLVSLTHEKEYAAAVVVLES